MIIPPSGAHPYAGRLSGNKADAQETGNEPTWQKVLRDLQRQLQMVMQQMERVRASSAAPEQKLQQLQALNNQAATIQAQIQKTLLAQAEQMRKAPA
ncbi:hypothetical protein C0J09_04335 [Bordetella avium]|uniref:hypothetical protein n=1 Tax=Bordetella avium TaxID=521 RepID=UPI000FD8D0EA|nr:hypothetical protein [Bordetella avium]AZY48437.1 hypothetical protein C0J09_04335 [Bordetella avium]